MNRSDLVAQLRLQEGVRYKPYRDTVGKLTIGVGRNLDDVPLSDDEVDLLLSNDVTRAEAEAQKYPWYAALTPLRQNVIVNMIFNLGPTAYAGFHQTHAAISTGDYHLAAQCMLASKWATQVGHRATDLAGQLLAG